MRTFIRPVALKVGIVMPIGWHTFRHTYSSLLRQNRTAVYGPVRTVVWQGSAGDRGPYADQTPSY
jgi:hypothetical protein